MRFKSNYFASLIFTLIFTLSAFSQEEKNALDIWNDMTEGSLIQDQKKIYVENIKEAGNHIMFGAEKEGSSYLITKIAGLNKKGFRDWVITLPLENHPIFLKNFLSGMASGEYSIGEVKNLAGESVKLDLSDFKNLNFQKMSIVNLFKYFNIFLDRAGDKSFSHIKPEIKRAFYEGQFKGLNKKYNLKQYSLRSKFSEYVPLWGEPEKYISKVLETSVGWEINFKPQDSYGEFEKMISWFRKKLATKNELFDAPGHQWVVFPKTKEALESKKKALVLLDKLNEIHKNNQAYIVLKAIEGNVDIQYSPFKEVQTHKKLFGAIEKLEKVEDLDNPSNFFRRIGTNIKMDKTHHTKRGVIRLQDDRFKVEGNNAYNIEFRAGTKNDPTRRKIQKFLISRYAAQELDDLASGKSWVLNDDEVLDGSKISERMGLKEGEFEKFYRKILKADGRLMKRSFLVPFWKWENAPYLTPEKKLQLKEYTKIFVQTVANLENPTEQNLTEALKSWVKSSRLSSDIENYLKPKPRLSNPETAHLFPVKTNAPVDINKIDLGIEYTGRFPLSTDADYVAVPGQNNKLEWRKTYLDYTPSERKDVIKKFAETLGKELNNGRAIEVISSSSDGHGHGLDISYDLRDDQGRKWRVEWDGVGRSYDTNGKVIPESLRGGHIEIVTPKFTPTKKDMDSLFEAMNKTDLIPSARMGGGHINIDLKPFEGNPKAMARFLGVYLDNRSMMSLLFQHPGRGVGAEPNRVTPNLISKLKNFNGTEEELKTLLYNEQFFNTRVGRKTKNNQLNLIAYFQDVIPEEFIHEDFDMKNDIWRRTFDVDPKIRKMEFRLFNAPINAAESALHIKYVRALLNKALNDTDPVFLGNYEVDYEKFAKDPEASMKEFEKHMKNLGLDPKEYRPFLLDGLELSKAHTESPKFLSTEEKLKPHPEIKDWKKAAPSRTNPIASAGRKWSGEGVEPEAKVYKENLQKGRVVAEAARKTKDPEGKLVKEITVSSGSIQTGAACSTPGEALNQLLTAPL